jgi:uncharacterized protein YbjT (DUF2867 family)
VKVIIFGATGMVGQGVLRECLLDAGVEKVLTVGRIATGEKHAKLREVVQADLLDISPLAGQLAGYDACLFCLGVSGAWMKQADYRRVTYDLTLSVAKVLLECNPAMTFLYISGSGTDSTERSSMMWARVKGATENALLRMPFKAAYMLRPGYIQPLHGIRTKTAWYRAFYAVLAPFYPLLKLVPRYVTTTECVGRAMVRVARDGYGKPVLENLDINKICQEVAGGKDK